MASNAASRVRSVEPAIATFSVNDVISVVHWLTGNSMTATQATHWAADDGREFSVPNVFVIYLGVEKKSTQKIIHSNLFTLPYPSISINHQSLTFFLMTSRIISGIDSHLFRYSWATSASLLVKWFLSCKPAAVRATGLYATLTSTSDNALKKSGKFATAACSKYVFAAKSSFLSVKSEKIEI